MKGFHLLPMLMLVTMLASACSPREVRPVATEPPEVKLPASVRTLSPEEAAAWLSTTPNALIVDNRGELEFKEERIPNAQLYDFMLGEENDKRLAKLDHNRPILLYCAIGGRSKIIAARMAEKGFTQLVWLKGGLNAWAAAGKTIQQ